MDDVSTPSESESSPQSSSKSKSKESKPNISFSALSFLSWLYHLPVLRSSRVLVKKFSPLLKSLVALDILLVLISCIEIFISLAVDLRSLAVDATIGAYSEATSLTEYPKELPTFLM